MSEGTPRLTPRQAARRRNPEVTARIGRNIRHARLELDMTQRELAKLVDEYTDANAVSRWECGRTRPMERTLDRLAEVLRDGDVAWFYAINDDEIEEAAA